MPSGGSLTAGRGDADVRASPRALRTRWSQAEADAQMVGIECDVHLDRAGPGRHLAGDPDTGERAEEWSEVVADDLRRWPPADRSSPMRSPRPWSAPGAGSSTSFRSTGARAGPAGTDAESGPRRPLRRSPRLLSSPAEQAVQGRRGLRQRAITATCPSSSCAQHRPRAHDVHQRNRGSDERIDKARGIASRFSSVREVLDQQRGVGGSPGGDPRTGCTLGGYPRV